MSIQNNLARLLAQDGNSVSHDFLGLTGVVFPFAGTTAPTGWLLCAGQAVNRTTYAALFAVIGTTYGSGNGTTTFNVPDLRGRVIAGADNMGGTAANRLTSAGSGVSGAIGSAGGAETHTLSSAQIPAHTHTGSTASAGSHTHTVAVTSGPTQTSSDYGPTALAGPGSGTSGTAGDHTHSVTVNANTGGGNAHNNTQPTVCLNYIIKA